MVSATWRSQVATDVTTRDPDSSPASRATGRRAAHAKRQAVTSADLITAITSRSLSAPAYPVKKMCTWLSVSASGFFDWRQRSDSATARRRERLCALIREAFESSDETYGYRRIHAQLARWGVPCGPELVRGIMRELGLWPCQPRPWRASLTEQDGRAHHIPDLVARDFTAERPGQKFVGDITYIPTWEGWLYLATVIDCHTKMVVGYAMDDNYKTPLIVEALTQAADRTTLVADAIFHSDRGSNYCSREFAATIAEVGMRQSVGRTGICYEVSSPGGLHPRALSEPCVKVSLHTAPTVEPVGRAPCRQCANNAGNADATSASFRRARRLARRNRLYFRTIHFTRNGLIRCSRKWTNSDL